MILTGPADLCARHGTSRVPTSSLCKPDQPAASCRLPPRHPLAIISGAPSGSAERRAQKPLHVVDSHSFLAWLEWLGSGMEGGGVAVFDNRTLPDGVKAAFSRCPGVPAAWARVVVEAA